MRRRCRRWSPSVVLSLASCLGVGLRLANADSGLCRDGECIDCLACSGGCGKGCRCFSEVNTCCCPSPAGHYARGYKKIPCPGGTYQDGVNKFRCKLCNMTGSETYNISRSGATSDLECKTALCDPTDTAAIGTACWTPKEVEKFLTGSVPNYDFCKEMTGAEEKGADGQLVAAKGVRFRSCNWRTPEGQGGAVRVGGGGGLTAWLVCVANVASFMTAAW
eukprot:TRINITY_DN62772_c0_g1_i1.p1 TRINITY_DN62772_c0_g1~~TRINITY_DN62772_c0_g1_i1.p1  ORF type:complete len:220 (-),score=35.24 TRINITY_DN62772_c0_g1_i1:26-685(-)